MNLFLDNTGVQAAGLALEGKAHDESDTKELLQLAELLVFAQQLVVGGYEIDRVRRATREVRDRLVSVGLDRTAIDLCRLSAKSFYKACVDAAGNAAVAMEAPLELRSDALGRLYPERLGSDTISENLRSMRRIIWSELNDADLAAEKEKARNAKKAGAVLFMLTAHEGLRAAMARALRRDCSDQILHCAEAFCRAHLNAILAKREQAQYTPAVARAQGLRREGETLVERLSHLTDPIVAKLRNGVSLPVPAISAYLLLESKGDPRGLIELALQLRKGLEELRRLLAKRLAEMQPGSSEAHIELDKEIRSYGHALSAELGLEGRPCLHDAIDVVFPLGLPTPKVSVGKLVEWLKFQWDLRRIAVLTEVSRKVAFADRDVGPCFEKLVRNCMARAPQ